MTSATSFEGIGVQAVYGLSIKRIKAKQDSFPPKRKIINASCVCTAEDPFEIAGVTARDDFHLETKRCIN